MSKVITRVILLDIFFFQDRISRAMICNSGSIRTSSRQRKDVATRRNLEFGIQSAGETQINKSPTSFTKLSLLIPFRAKWEAWNRLGGMSAEKAMDSYVEELKRVKVVRSILILIVNYNSSGFACTFRLSRPCRTRIMWPTSWAVSANWTGLV